MKPLIIPREVWRPIDQCPYREGETYLVKRTGKDHFVKARVSGGLLYRSVRGGYFEPVTDGTKFILYPQDDLVKAEENACNDIPLEIAYPYIIRNLRKAEKDLNTARADTEIVRKEKYKVEVEMMALRRQLQDAYKEVDRLKKAKRADEEMRKAKQRLEYQSKVIKDVRKILGLLIGGDTEKNNDRIKYIIEKLIKEVDE